MAGRDLGRLRLMLQVAAVRRYAALPIPSDEDVLVEEFVREWRSGSSKEPEAHQALDRLVQGMLGSFAVRSASRAVRDRNVEHVRLGLTALCIGGAEDDPRDLEQVACVLFDSCVRVGVEPAALFLEAAGGARGGAARILRTFADMSKEDVSLTKYRIRENEDDGGFRYRLGLSGAA